MDKPAPTEGERGHGDLPATPNPEPDEDDPAEGNEEE